MKASDLSNIVEIHGDAIYSFCYFLTKDKSSTDDLYQDTFLKALELCHKIDPEKNPKSFIISIAIGLWKNKCRKLARQQKIMTNFEANDDVIDCYTANNETPEEIVLNNELSSMVQAAVASLDTKLKLPLYMYYTVDMPIEDIAKALKTPKGTVKSRLFKARKSIKNILEVYKNEAT